MLTNDLFSFPCLSTSLLSRTTFSASLLFNLHQTLLPFVSLVFYIRPQHIIFIETHTLFNSPPSFPSPLSPLLLGGSRLSLQNSHQTPQDCSGSARGDAGTSARSWRDSETPQTGLSRLRTRHTTGYCMCSYRDLTVSSTPTQSL